MSENQRCCYVCKKPIDPDRLEVLIETELCVDHAREILQYGGEFIRSSTQETTSKQSSLKKNYGSVNLDSKRNQKAMDQLRDAYLQSQS